MKQIKKCDLTGEVYGNLTVLKPDEDRNTTEADRAKNGEIVHAKKYWVCECSNCGKEVTVSADNLRSGNTKGCGCTRGRERKYNLIVHDDSLNCSVISASNTTNPCYVDDDDVNLINKFCWYQNNYGYMMTRDPASGRQILLHRLIMNNFLSDDDNLIIDHINRNRMDCRKQNLRVCNCLENSRNRNISSANSSGRTGVSYDTNTEKWRAYISDNRQFISLGYYSSFEDAVDARNRAETELYGEFAPK